MDLALAKIPELDVSKPLAKKQYKKLAKGTTGEVDLSRGQSKPGGVKLTGSLRVQSIALKSSSSTPKSDLFQLLPGSYTPSSGPSQKVRVPADEPKKDLLPSEEQNIPTPPHASNQMEPQKCSVNPPRCLSVVDPLFIRSVTMPDLVYGERRFKCLCCLCYYDRLDCLLKHIQQGWKEGFSCRVFYHRLRSMHQHRCGLSGHEAHTLSRCRPQLSDPSLSVSSVESLKSCSSEDKKMDMIWNWLQTAEITALPE